MPLSETLWCRSRKLFFYSFIHLFIFLITGKGGTHFIFLLSLCLPPTTDPAALIVSIQIRLEAPAGPGLNSLPSGDFRRGSWRLSSECLSKTLAHHHSENTLRPVLSKCCFKKIMLIFAGKVQMRGQQEAATSGLLNMSFDYFIITQPLVIKPKQISVLMIFFFMINTHNI